MFVSSDQLSPESRVWIYQSPRIFSETEAAFIQRYLKDFCENWVAHGSPLKVSFEIRYNQFVVLFADESYNNTSGCSIDSSVRAIKELGQQLSIDFFDRRYTPFLGNDRNIFLLELSRLKEFYQEGMWNEHTLTLNNLVATKAAFNEHWITPAGHTWLKRYVVKETIKT